MPQISFERDGNRVIGTVETDDVDGLNDRLEAVFGVGGDEGLRRLSDKVLEAHELGGPDVVRLTLRDVFGDAPPDRFGVTAIRGGEGPATGGRPSVDHDRVLDRLQATLRSRRAGFGPPSSGERDGGPGVAARTARQTAHITVAKTIGDAAAASTREWGYGLTTIAAGLVLAFASVHPFRTAVGLAFVGVGLTRLLIPYFGGRAAAGFLRRRHDGS
jgi:hypothetical protein